MCCAVLVRAAGNIFFVRTLNLTGVDPHELVLVRSPAGTTDLEHVCRAGRASI